MILDIFLNTLLMLSYIIIGTIVSSAIEGFNNNTDYYEQMVTQIITWPFILISLIIYYIVYITMAIGYEIGKKIDKIFVDR